MIAGFSTGSKVSDDDLQLLSRLIPAFRFERNARGELIVTPNGTESGRQSGELFGQLWSWNKVSSQGCVFDSSAGFTMPDGALYSPDAAWVERARYEAVDRAARRRYEELCPDVVFEILSPSDRPPAARERIAEYVKYGARLAVSLNPFTGTVEIRSYDREPEILARPARLVLEARYFGAAAADFVLDLNSIFGT